MSFGGASDPSSSTTLTAHYAVFANDLASRCLQRHVALSPRSGHRQNGVPHINYQQAPAA